MADRLLTEDGFAILLEGDQEGALLLDVYTAPGSLISTATETQVMYSIPSVLRNSGLESQVMYALPSNQVLTGLDVQIMYSAKMKVLSPYQQIWRRV